MQPNLTQMQENEQDHFFKLLHSILQCIPPSFINNCHFSSYRSMCVLFIICLYKLALSVNRMQKKQKNPCTKLTKTIHKIEKNYSQLYIEIDST